MHHIERKHIFLGVQHPMQNNGRCGEGELATKKPCKRRLEWWDRCMDEEMETAKL